MKAFTDSQGNSWTCTDPDSLQYGRQISEKIFEFKEFERFDNQEEFEALKELGDKEILKSMKEDECWHQETVNLTHYSTEQIESKISGYYDSIAEVEKEYGDEANWIIAECIFEYDSGMY